MLNPPGLSGEPKRGGTYRGTQLDGHSTYTSLGKVTLPLAADFKLIDCGDNPTDAYDTIKVAQESYLKKVKDYKKEDRKSVV